jgi:hypothetical protein
VSCAECGVCGGRIHVRNRGQIRFKGEGYYLRVRRMCVLAFEPPLTRYDFFEGERVFGIEHLEPPGMNLGTRANLGERLSKFLKNFFQFGRWRSDDGLLAKLLNLCHPIAWSLSRGQGDNKQESYGGR